MKISIELSEQEKMKIMNAVSKAAVEIGEKAIAKYFENIKQDDFIMLIRRALRTSCDSFFQHFMQYYIEQRAPEIYKKLHKDILHGAKSLRKR